MINVSGEKNIDIIPVQIYLQRYRGGEALWLDSVLDACQAPMGSGVLSHHLAERWNAAVRKDWLAAAAAVGLNCLMSSLLRPEWCNQELFVTLVDRLVFWLTHPFTNRIGYWAKSWFKEQDGSMDESVNRQVGDKQIGQQTSWLHQKSTLFG